MAYQYLTNNYKREGSDWDLDFLQGKSLVCYPPMHGPFLAVKPDKASAEQHRRLRVETDPLKCSGGVHQHVFDQIRVRYHQPRLRTEPVQERPPILLRPVSVERRHPAEYIVAEGRQRFGLGFGVQLPDLPCVSEHGAESWPRDALFEEVGLDPPWEVEVGVSELEDEYGR